MTSSGREKYVEAVGRRKTSIARVRLTPSTKMHITVNNKTLAEYLPIPELQHVITDSFAKIDLKKQFNITVRASGGGIASQAEAIRLGIARALVEIDTLLRGPLKKHGFLKRNPRAKERRKFGLKKARKAPQWSKR